jgi:uroporphyrinogen III methyltransferase/synthase
MLEKLGCKVLNVPTIRITEPDDPDNIRNGLKNLSAFEWIIFTSANAVRYFFEFKNIDNDDIQKIKIACIGKKTAEVLKSFSLESQLIPDIFSNQGLLDKIQLFDIRGKHILLPVSNAATDELQKGLQALGVHVKRIEVYKNMPHRDSQWDTIYEKMDNNLIDCIAFYSPSALNAFAELIGENGISLINDKKIAIAVVGYATARAARENNFHPDIIPTVSDDEHFVEALKGYFGVMG